MEKVRYAPTCSFLSTRKSSKITSSLSSRLIMFPIPPRRKREKLRMERTPRKKSLHPRKMNWHRLSKMMEYVSSSTLTRQLKKFTVPQLKEWLKSQGVKVPSKWKKDEVVQKVKEMVGPSTATTTTETRSSDPIQVDNCSDLSHVHRMMKKSSWCSQARNRSPVL